MVIREYGILNDRIEAGDAFLFGIPYPGVYVADESGVVVAKFFHDTYKKRDSPEILIDAALGRVELDDEAPREIAGDAEVRITAAIHGGAGTIRQGIIRNVVVRFELDDGLHLYGDPVPRGMIATRVEVSGPPGLVVEDPIVPATRPLRLESLGIELAVRNGTFDIVVPIYPTGELASETRPLDAPSIPIQVRVAYQACDDDQCLLPREETLTLEVPLDVIDIPKIPMHRGHGQREGAYDGRRHLFRLILRKVRRHPIGFFRFILKSVRLERAAAARRRG